MTAQRDHKEFDTRYGVPIRRLRSPSEIEGLSHDEARYIYNDSEPKHLVIDSLLVPRESDTLIVVFHALADRAKIVTPHFQFRSTLSGRGESVLFLADTALELDATLESSWYIGTETDNLRDRLVCYIQAVAAKVSAKYIILMGLSAGGFAALSYSFQIKNSVALAFAPQSDIRRYYGGRWLSLVNALFPHASSPSDVYDADPGRVDLLTLYSQRPLPNAFIYWQNTEDPHHVESHYIPFAKTFDVEPGGGQSGDGRSVFIREYEGEGHICPTRPRIMQLIDQAIVLAKSLYPECQDKSIEHQRDSRVVCEPIWSDVSTNDSSHSGSQISGNGELESNFKVLGVSLTRMSEDAGLKRLPRRPSVEWTESFWQGFDSRTVFIDAFQVGSDVMLVGPALENLAVPLQGASWFCDGAEIPPPKIVDAHLINITIIRGVGTVQTVEIRGDEFRFELHVNPNFRHVFMDRKVILTVSKDNPLPWITDWIKFHRDQHGTDAVLIIDNGSTSYTMDQLLSAIKEVSGIAVGVVVQVDIPYGPGPNAQGVWDANYFQFTAIEYARWKFLADAAGVIQGDIDELVLTDDGRSVYDHALEDPQGVCCYYGRYFERIDEPRADLPRHRDVMHYDPNTKRSGSKWTVIPRLNPSGFQWLVHSVRGHSGIVSDVLLRHFMLINTGWKYKYRRVEFDPSVHQLDMPLAEALAASFHE